jgi:predicted ribosome quality control (RQC) complex YloA/Tae2 family protein
MTDERDERASGDVERTQRALEALVGARVDRVFVCESTGLIELSLYDRGRRVLVAGVGPSVWGVGVGERVARIRDDASRPLVAALRAHVVDHRVRAVSIEDGALWLSFGNEQVSSRLALWPGRKGGAQVYAADGRLIARHPPSQSAAVEPEWGDPREVESRGDLLVEQSDRKGFDRAKIELARAVRTARTATERRAEAVKGDLARLESVERLQKIGRLLLAQGAKVPRGTKRATLDDWEEGGTLEVALDPAKPAKAQAETFFAKARRYQRGEAVMTRRLAECEARAELLRALEAEVAAANPAANAEWTALITRARSLGAKLTDASATPTGASAKKARAERRLPYLVFRDERGKRILVGRGGADNDALTTDFARPHDLWLHAKERTGAHVIVPLDKGQTCPSEQLVDAATLAAHFSDVRGESVCEITYVLRRYVRKPKGSAVGAVTYDHEKVLVLRLEPERVERLLATREE